MLRPTSFPLPDPTPPEPISAFWDNSESAAYINFSDKLQAPGASNAGTFTAHTLPRRYQAGAVTLAGAETVRVAGINMVVVAGAGTIDYDASLGTLIGLNGLPVVSFTGFPCPAVP